MTIPRFASQDEAERLIAGPALVWVFKHSSACPTSHAAYEEVASYLVAHPGDGIGMVVVQNDRPLSNWLAARLGRVHQSPQLFLVQAGRIAWSASHWSITAEAMAKARGALAS